MTDWEGVMTEWCIASVCSDASHRSRCEQASELMGMVNSWKHDLAVHWNATCLDFVVDKCYRQGKVEEIVVRDKAILL